jgi:hypothetical protein
MASALDIDINDPNLDQYPTFTVRNLCEDSDDSGEWPNTNAASISPLPLSRKRPRDKEDSSNSEGYPPYENSPGNKTATGSADFVVDLELAEEVEVSNSAKKRKRHVMDSARNDAAAGYCRETTEKDVGMAAAQVAAHRESQHEGIAAAASASHPMNSDSEQTSRDNESTNNHSEKLSTSEPPSNASGRPWKVCAWKDRLSDLVDYRKIHGHCNVSQRCSERTKLATWVATQRTQYKLHLDGKPSFLTLPRIQELESLAFEWNCNRAAWENRLSELADYRKINGHCNVTQHYIENTQLAYWVTTQRRDHTLHLE